MSTNIQRGSPIFLDIGEVSVPCNNWLSWFNKIAVELVKMVHVKQKIDGYKYTQSDYWEVIAAGTMLGLGTQDACDYLNALKYEKINEKRRKKISPVELGSAKGIRKERLVPCQSQVDSFKRLLPLWASEKLINLVFKAQIKVAITEGMLEQPIRMVVDFTEHPYYGKIDPTNDALIVGSVKQQGTHKVRNYLAATLISGTFRMFCSLKQVAKKADRSRIIMEMVDDILSLGLKIDWLLVDRGFWNFETIAGCIMRKIKLIEPAKIYKKIKAMAEDFLLNGGDFVRQYPMSGAPSKYYKYNSLPGWIIFGTINNISIEDLRKQVKAKSMSIDDALKRIYALFTTDSPPPKGSRRTAWANNLRKLYKKRWYIESGFRDTNRLMDVEHPRNHGSKFLMLGLRMIIYNCWQFERARRWHTRIEPKCHRYGPKLARFRINQIEQYKAVIMV
jgi:hypothetical protein